jgi:hypothetical protein
MIASLQKFTASLVPRLKTMVTPGHSILPGGDKTEKLSMIDNWYIICLVMQWYRQQHLRYIIMLVFSLMSKLTHKKSVTMC